MLLFKLKPPITEVVITKKHGVAGTTHMAFEVSGKFVGALNIPADQAKEFALNVLADIRTSVGYIEDGELVWYQDPAVYGFTTVIDGYGDIHSVDML